MSNDHFIFRTNQTIGAAAAEQDEQFLNDCFVDNEILPILLDCEDHRSILVGRTGAGKSALISRLISEEEHVISILPDSLSLAYVSNSNVINFFSEAGVNLTLFYRLLWRHVFVVEILKERFKIDSEKRKENFISSIWSVINKNSKHQMALEYLQEWGDSFWQETDYRVKEVTKHLEEELQGAIKGAFPDIVDFDLSSAKKLTKEQKEEVINRGQQVVSKVQVKKLSIIIEFLGEILLSDRQKKYYIVIDRLDEDWIEDKVRFRLIRGLIETSLEFTRIKNIKVIVAIRNDLLDRVYRFTRDPGFQEEKYRTSSIDLLWSKTSLVEMLDRRIDKLVKSQYTKKKVTHNDLLRPIHVTKGKPIRSIEYMLTRTLLRPRDLIDFFNQCIKLSDGKPMIDVGTLMNAEGIYSRARFRALVDEWIGVYPNLGSEAQILMGRRSIFKVNSLEDKEIEELCLQVVTSSDAIDGEDLELARRVLEDSIKVEDYRKELLIIFYKVGLIGLKTNAHMSTSWSYLGGLSISKAEIGEESQVYVHPTFWRHFGIPDDARIKMPK